MRQVRDAQPDACLTCGFPSGQPGYLRSDFPPGHPRFGALVACPDCHDATLSDRLKRTSQLTGWLKTATFDKYQVDAENKKAYETALKFATWPRAWVTFWGSFGPGKTHLLAAIVNHCTAHNIAAVYYTLPDLLDKMRDSYGDDLFSPLMSKLVKVPVLALDEVDKARLTQWAIEKVYQLIDARYRDLDTKGTVLAMNVSPDPTDEVLGYLFSRCSDRRNSIVEVGGGDVRPVIPA